MAKKIDYASMFTLRKDGRYQASYTDAKGRHYLYDKDPERLWHKLNDPKEPEKYLLKNAAEDWQRVHWERISHKTAEAYTAPTRRIIERYGETKLEDITAADINAYLIGLGKQGFSKRTVQMSRDIFNMIFNHAILHGKAKTNPCVAVSVPRGLEATKRTLPDDEAIEAVKKSADLPFGLFALLCLYAGLRRGEALALTYEDIDRDRKVIRVNKSIEYIGNNPHVKAPKTAAGIRETVLLDVLADHIPNGKGYIFATENGTPYTKIMYRKRWQKYCEAIGFDITAHQLRHGFATILYEAGIADKDAQELLGHANITTTRDVYTHIRQSRRNETTDKLNSFLQNSSSF